MGHLSNSFDYNARADLTCSLTPASLPVRLPWHVAASLIIGISGALWGCLSLLAERVFG